VDRVQEQIRIATGEPLGNRDREYEARGHASECRINAEDPVTFAPHPGTIDALHFPGGYGVRVDSHVYQGYTVPPFYDSMIGKLITHGDDRSSALARMRSALSEIVVDGISTNVPLHQDLCHDKAFMDGGTDIHYLERKLAQ